MMSPPVIVEALSTRFGEPSSIHTAVPPFHLGGELVDVAEIPQPDGSVRYVTAGLTGSGDRPARELMLHATGPDPRFPELMARLGGSTRHRSYPHGSTLPLAGPPDQPPPFDGLGFLFSGETLQVADALIYVNQIFGLTRDELEAARAASLYTVEAALWRDGRDLISEPGRATTPSLERILPVHPGEAALSGVSPDAREVADIAIHGDHDRAEGIRDVVTEADAKILATALAGLPHPTQLATLLHCLMDHSIPELETASLQLLELQPPDHFMACQYYADALAMLGVIGGADHWETYATYDGDLDAAKAKRAELLGSR